jgi:DNA-binding transcriptional regulator YiaG
MKRKYQSELLKACHQEAEDLFAVGALSETEMREFDRDCLVREQVPTSASGIRQDPARTSPRQT